MSETRSCPPKTIGEETPGSQREEAPWRSDSQPGLDLERELEAMLKDEPEAPMAFVSEIARSIPTAGVVVGQQQGDEVDGQRPASMLSPKKPVCSGGDIFFNSTARGFHGNHSRFEGDVSTAVMMEEDANDPQTPWLENQLEAMLDAG